MFPAVGFSRAISRDSVSSLPTVGTDSERADVEADSLGFSQKDDSMVVIPRGDSGAKARPEGVEIATGVSGGLILVKSNFSSGPILVDGAEASAIEVGVTGAKVLGIADGVIDAVVATSSGRAESLLRMVVTPSLLGASFVCGALVGVADATAFSLALTGAAVAVVSDLKNVLSKADVALFTAATED